MSTLVTAGTVFLDERFPLPLDRPFGQHQALAAGVSRRVLGRLVREGLVRRLTRGVYAASQAPDSRENRGRALALCAPPYTVICDWTACWYWTGVDRPGRHIETEIDAFRFRGYDRLQNGLARSGQRWFVHRDVAQLEDGLFVTTPLRTAWDLGRFSPAVIALGGMDALARCEGVTVPRLCAEVERFRRQRGVVQLRVLAPLVDDRSESPGESALRWRWIEAAGLPEPELQIPVSDDSGNLLYRIDLGHEALRFGAEYDGRDWHAAEQEEYDLGRRDVLDREFGWAIKVFRAENVFGQRQDATNQLAQAFREAKRSFAARSMRWL